MKQFLGISLILFAVLGFMLIAPPGVYQDEQQAPEVLIEVSEVIPVTEFTILESINHFTIFFDEFEARLNTDIVVNYYFCISTEIRMPDFRERSMNDKNQTAPMRDNRIRRDAILRAGLFLRQPSGIGLINQRSNDSLNTDYHIIV